MSHPASVGAQALIPNPALQPFAFLIGEWRTRGAHPGLPGADLQGRTLFAWHLGGAFIRMTAEVDHPDMPSGQALIGSDDGAGTFALQYFDEREVSRIYALFRDGRTVTWRRDDPSFRQEVTLRADGDDQLHMTSRIAEPGYEWTDDLALSYTRVA